MNKPIIAYYLSASVEPGQPQIERRADEQCYAHVIRVNPLDAETIRAYFTHYSLVRLYDDPARKAA